MKISLEESKIPFSRKTDTMFDVNRRQKVNRKRYEYQKDMGTFTKNEIRNTKILTVGNNTKED